MRRAARNSFDDDKAFNIAIGVWAVCMLAGLALWATVIYVAFHFIGKFW